MHVLFLDTETNGLPQNRYAPYTSTSMWPHIIQISWVVVDTSDWSVIKDEDHFLKPRAKWSSEAERIHQIPESIATKFGKDPVEVFSKLHDDLKNCSVVIAHNLSFDKTAIMSEVHRLYEANTYPTNAPLFWTKIKEVCTMTLTKTLCGLTFKNSKDLKFPRLNELYHRLFKVEYDISGAELHNSKHDTGCLIMCVKELIKLPGFERMLDV